MPFSNYIPSSRVSQAGVCTSTTRPATPYEGQMIYETDTNRVLVYDNTAWVMIADTDVPPALSLITPTSVSGTGVSLSGSQVVFTSTSSININGCFTDEFTNYKIAFRALGSGAQVSAFFKLRASGTDSSSGYDQGGMYCTRSGVTGTLSGTAQTTGWYLTNVTQYARAMFTGDIFGPKLSEFTTVGGVSYEQDAGWWVTGQHQVSTAYDGLTIYITATTMTGTVSIYGYRK